MTDDGINGTFAIIDYWVLIVIVMSRLTNNKYRYNHYNIARTILSEITKY